MLTRINDVDEFEYFSQNYRKLAAEQPEAMKQILFNAPFTLKYRDYLKIVLASKRITIKLGAASASGSKKKNDIPEDRPGDRAMRENPKANAVEEDEEEQKEISITRKFIKVKRRAPDSTIISASSQMTVHLPSFLNTPSDQSQD